MSSDQPDREVILDVLSGNRNAFRGVVEKYQERLFGLAMRLTRSRQDSEDLVQAAFVKMFEKLGSYDPNYEFSTWAYTITMNMIRNHQRRKRLIRFLSLGLAFGPDAPEEFGAEAEPASREPGVEAQLEQEALAKELERSIASLPHTLKEVFVLYYMHEEPVRSISAILGLSENAVKLRLMRGREAIRNDRRFR